MPPRKKSQPVYATAQKAYIDTIITMSFQCGNCKKDVSGAQADLYSYVDSAYGNAFSATRATATCPHCDAECSAEDISI